MSKNPFVNCKSRKRRKVRAPIVKPKEKLFCPRTMVRYDNSPSVYSTIWVCKMCLKSMLSEDACKNHLITCNTSTRRFKANPPTKNNEDTRYICETCNKEFARRVTLKKHLEVHEKSSSGIDSEESHDEVEESNDVDEVDLLNAENEDYDDDDDDDDDDDESEEENPRSSIMLMT